MNRTHQETYNGHEIEIWRVRRFVGSYGGSVGEYDDFIVTVDGQNVNHLVLSLGSGPDQWIERARSLIDTYLSN
jgi:hypothetical protein